MKIKLITIFLLGVSAVALVGYISYQGLSKIMTSLEMAIRPDNRKEHFNQLIYALSEAENGVRVYTITQDAGYLESFYNAVSEADRQMEILYAYAEKDAVLADHLDTISSLIERKIDLQKSLIELKDDASRVDVYQRMMEKILSIEKKNEELDSLELERGTPQDPDPSDEQMAENAGEEEEETKKRGFFRRLFSSNKKSESEPEEEPNQVVVSEDSLLLSSDTLLLSADTLKRGDISQELKLSIAEIKTQEQEKNRGIARTELFLTRKDQEISEHIKGEVKKIEQHFDREKLKAAENATMLFDDTTRLITVVGTISAMAFLIMVFIILNDFQVNQRFRRRLEAAKKKAEDLARAKEDFLSSMSHEIRTPMNAIMGFAEQLNLSELRAEQQQYLKIIRNSSRHLLSIINDILDYNRLEAGKIKIEKEAFSVVENAHIVYDSLLISARMKGLQFELKTDGLFNTKNVVGDALRFRQILFNLAGNALKFTERGSVKITINYLSQAVRPCLEMVVEDTGIGISKAESEIIFNKFDQADQSISRKYGGTGLGLAIVKKLVDLQGGNIAVKSKEGEGSSFIVSLPYTLSDTEPTPEQLPAAIPHKTFHGYQVLIVDDEEYNVLLFEIVLKKYGFTTVSAKSGPEALEAVQRHDFDLILLDLQMKELDGFNTLKKMRAEHRVRTTVIAITASSSREINRKCKSYGFADVILKPVQEKEFIERVGQHLGPEPVPQKSDPKQENPMQEKFEDVFKLVQNDETLALNMINIYYRNIQHAKDTILDCRERKNAPGIREAVHKIIPSTRHVGFEELVHKFKFVEDNFAGRDDFEKHKKLIDEIIGEVDIVIGWVKDFLQEKRRNAEEFSGKS